LAKLFIFFCLVDGPVRDCSLCSRAAASSLLLGHALSPAMNIMFDSGIALILSFVTDVDESSRNDVKS